MNLLAVELTVGAFVGYVVWGGASRTGLPQEPAPRRNQVVAAGSVSVPSVVPATTTVHPVPQVVSEGCRLRAI